MKRMNNKGFTLVELIATIVLLALVMGIGVVSITTIIKNAKEKDYDLLIENIYSAVELYHQECMYGDTSIDCPYLSSGYYYMELGDLVEYGFIKGNAATSDDSLILTNPKNGKDLDRCSVRYQYVSGVMELEAVTGGSCPTTSDYNK